MDPRDLAVTVGSPRPTSTATAASSAASPSASAPSAPPSPRRSGGGGAASPGGRRRPSANLNMAAFKARLRRLNIMDQRTGLSLFERVWSWRGNTSVDGLDALVATFYQFSGSIDKTRVGVSRVLFELPQVRLLRHPLPVGTMSCACRPALASHHYPTPHPYARALTPKPPSVRIVS